MNINIKQKQSNNLNNEQANIYIEYSSDIDIENMIDYINKYNKQVVVRQDNELFKINIKDIILFYSDKKNNYCRTKDGEYKVKNKLYELEKQSYNFVRISKSCIVNIEHVKSFDVKQTGTIIVKLDDNTTEIVSRRKIKDVMNYLEERSI